MAWIDNQHEDEKGVNTIPWNLSPSTTVTYYLSKLDQERYTREMDIDAFGPATSNYRKMRQAIKIDNMSKVPDANIDSILKSLKDAYSVMTDDQKTMACGVTTVRDADHLFSAAFLSLQKEIIEIRGQDPNEG